MNTELQAFSVWRKAHDDWQKAEAASEQNVEAGSEQNVKAAWLNLCNAGQKAYDAWKRIQKRGDESVTPTSRPGHES